MSSLLRFRPGALAALFLAVTCSLIIAPALRAAAPAVVDDFSDAALTSRHAPRLLFNDKDAGSHSHAAQRCENGVLVVQGELVPGRGAPAFISVPLLLTPDAKPEDLSAYTGVRLRVKLIQGPLAVQVSTTEVDNFDYHSAPVVAPRGEFTEVRIPFADMKRAWSAQTALNRKLVTSVNLVTFGTAPSAFEYELDEIGFY